MDLSMPAAGAVAASMLAEDEVGDFYGDSAFDSEDFDVEGFEISEGNSY